MLVNLGDRIRKVEFSSVNGNRAPFLIAEAGVNHGGSMDLAKRLIDEAAEGGADAIKFQSYKAETLACKNSPSYWDRSQEASESQYELFKRYDKFWKSEYEELFSYCGNAGIEFLSTPFDVNSATFLADLVSAFKISSSDITNKILVDHICGYKKPILLSTGASYPWEIDRTVELIESRRVSYSLMHCVLNYPTTYMNANLKRICSLKKRYPEIVVGYSDHTLPGDMSTLILATVLGAEVIEKHFTYDKSLVGNDHYHAMDKEDIKVFRDRCRFVLERLGDGGLDPTKNEMEARQNARRSLVTQISLAKGEILCRHHLISKRPASGIEPFEVEKVIGMKSAVDIPEDTILTWEMLDEA